MANKYNTIQFKGPQVFAFCVVKVNSAVVFKNFEHPKDLIILNI